MENQYLPPEYATELETLQKKQRLAQLLAQQGMSFQGAQSQGRMAARTSPLAWLSTALTGYLGNKADSEASAGIQGIRQKIQADTASKIDQLSGLPADQQPVFAAKTGNPQVAALAKLLQDQRQKRLEGFSGAVKDTNPGAAANTWLTGQLPTEYTPPALKASEEGQLSDGTRFVRDYNIKNEPTTRLVSKGINVVNQIPKAENAMALGVLEQGLKPREEAAVAAKNVISATNRAMDALVRGAQAGGGENIKQALRKGLQAFGVTPSATAETNELQMALGSAILSEAAKIKPISNTDIDTLREIVGGIGTDPNALVRALAFMQAESIRGLQGFGKYVSEQSATLQDPLARQRLAGVTVGMELPTQLFGPPAFQMAVMQQLQQAGGDISKFQNTSVGRGDAKSGSKTPLTQPFEADARFDIRQPAAGLAASKPATPPQVLTVDQLTPAQRAQLLKILQGGQ